MTLPVKYDDLSSWNKKKVREQYWVNQKGICTFCKEKLSDKPSKQVLDLDINKKLFPVGFFKYPVHLHHDHNTGLTLSAIHNKCNAVLFQYYGE